MERHGLGVTWREIDQDLRIVVRADELCHAQTGSNLTAERPAPEPRVGHRPGKFKRIERLDEPPLLVQHFSELQLHFRRFGRHGLRKGSGDKDRQRHQERGENGNGPQGQALGILGNR